MIAIQRNKNVESATSYTNMHIHYKVTQYDLPESVLDTWKVHKKTRIFRLVTRFPYQGIKNENHTFI